MNESPNQHARPDCGPLADQATRPPVKWTSIGLLGGTVTTTAMLAAIPPAMDVAGHGFDLLRWAMGFLTACACIASWRFASVRSAGPNNGLRAWGAAALSMAAFAPLAGQWSDHAVRANLTMMLVSLSAASSISGGRKGWALSAVCAALAGFCDATALIWPVGCLCTAIHSRAQRPAAALLLTACAVGAAINAFTGGPSLAAQPIRGSVFFAQADIRLLLPVLIVGGAGWARRRRTCSQYGDCQHKDSNVDWGLVGAVGLGLVLTGVRLDLRTCALPLWWHVPGGIEDLKDALSRRADRSTMVRCVGVLASIGLTLLLAASVRRWLDGPLIALHLLGGSM